MQLSDFDDWTVAAQATGVIMALWDRDSEQAWKCLIWGANHVGLSVDEVARCLVDVESRAAVAADWAGKTELS